MTHILIADPDPSFRKALILLVNHKMSIERVSEAADVGTLIQLLVGNPPDLLLLGWSLHGTSGPELCQLIRKSHPTVKIVLLSVNMDDEIVARSAGAEFLRKGAPAEEILDCLRTLVASPIL